MSNQELIKKLNKIDNDWLLQNFIAQAHARYVLFNTGEDIKNFPDYTIKDEKLDILAFYYLNIGCALVENGELELARVPLEKGASLLEYIHASGYNRKQTSNYYVLIAILSYYVSFQYSKSFILTRKFQSDTVLSSIIILFLKRDYTKLVSEINKLIVDDSYVDGNISEINDESVADKKICEITISRAINCFVRYFYSGDKTLLIDAKRKLSSLKEILEIKNDPGMWWIVRLLILVLDGFNEASLWNSLSKHFNTELPSIKTYIHSLVYNPKGGIHELFITQRKSLDKVLDYDNSGCVVSLPTSSGKTRIAEIAILDCLENNPTDKVLYIAPFRSLAYEIENSLGETLGNVGISLSHLYGGSLFSKLDREIIEDSQVIVATPEKAKAIMRSDKEILDQIKLVVIDEGHLLGYDKRCIVNEMFYEELRFHVEKNQGRFLLLSAVLPNSEELAEWLTGSNDTVYKDNWRPSDERLGVLEWTGKTVNINWKSNDDERASFNSNFVVSEEREYKYKGVTRVKYHSPGNKKEAIAQTAYKLNKFGSVLVFVGQKKSVFTMAKAYKNCLTDDMPDFQWTMKRDWRAFELACVETYGEDNVWLEYAKKGILCHNSDLHTDVRLPLERLMRNDNAPIIIATSTLGQGVNLGVSTVIYSTLYQSASPITSRDFWNIAGRAGRAFVDSEGKILVTLDKTQKKWQIRNNEKLIETYFDKSKIDYAISGIYSLAKDLKAFSSSINMQFDVFTQLISENKINEVGEKSQIIENRLDWIDDALLSLHDVNNNSEDVDSYEWVEEFFSGSLSYIQTKTDSILSQEELLRFLKARVEGIVKVVGNDRGRWRSAISSGMRLKSDLMLEEKMPNILSIISNYDESEQLIDDKINLLKLLEEELDEIHVLIDEKNIVHSNEMDEIRSSWLKGVPISEIIKYDKGIDIITKLYTYNFPWILNGIAKKIRNIDLEHEAEIIEELAVLVEVGLPEIKMVKIYQAGIRSRLAAKEIGDFFQEEPQGYSSKKYRKDLILNKEYYREHFSSATFKWVDLLSFFYKPKAVFSDIPNEFSFSNVHKHTNILIPQEINKEQYLVSPDLTFVQKIEGDDFDFSRANKIPGVFYYFDKYNDVWKIKNDNPYIDIE